LSDFVKIGEIVRPPRARPACNATQRKTHLCRRKQSRSLFPRYPSSPKSWFVGKPEIEHASLQTVATFRDTGLPGLGEALRRQSFRTLVFG